jgi:CheY-like chemotaxis protein
MQMSRTPMSNQPARSPDFLLPAGTLPVSGEIPKGHAAMAQRIRELESLCAEVYEAAVIQGLPQRLLDRLWIVAARGNHPNAFSYTLLSELEGTEDQLEPLPDIPLTHHPDRPQPALPKLPPLLARRTVMVVDDDPVMLEMLMKILGTDNYDLLPASSSEQALMMLDTHTPDLLVTDLMMPGLSGAELADMIRARLPAIRVLFQTGFADTLFRLCKELEPGEAFLEKPFSARGLLEASRFVLFGTLNPDSTTVV